MKPQDLVKNIDTLSNLIFYSPSSSTLLKDFDNNKTLRPEQQEQLLALERIIGDFLTQIEPEIERRLPNSGLLKILQTKPETLLKKEYRDELKRFFYELETALKKDSEQSEDETEEQKQLAESVPQNLQELVAEYEIHVAELQSNESKKTRLRLWEEQIRLHNRRIIFGIEKEIEDVIPEDYTLHAAAFGEVAQRVARKIIERPENRTKSSREIYIAVRREIYAEAAKPISPTASPIDLAQHRLLNAALALLPIITLQEVAPQVGVVPAIESGIEFAQREVKKLPQLPTEAELGVVANDVLFIEKIVYPRILGRIDEKTKSELKEVATFSAQLDSEQRKFITREFNNLQGLVQTPRFLAFDAGSQAAELARIKNAFKDKLSKHGISPDDLPTYIKTHLDYLIPANPDQLLSPDQIAKEAERIKDVFTAVEKLPGKQVDVSDGRNSPLAQNVVAYRRELFDLFYTHREIDGRFLNQLKEQHVTRLQKLHPSLDRKTILELLGAAESLPFIYQSQLYGSLSSALLTQSQPITVPRETVAPPTQFEQRFFPIVLPQQEVVTTTQMRGGAPAAAGNSLLNSMFNFATNMQQANAARLAAGSAARTVAAGLAAQPWFWPVIAGVAAIAGILILIIGANVVDSGAYVPQRNNTGGAPGGVFSGPAANASILGCPTNPGPPITQCPFNLGGTHENLNAYDIAAGFSQPVFATHDGVVTAYVNSFGPNETDGCKTIKGYGNHVILRATNGTHFTLYGHLLDVTQLVIDSQSNGTVIHTGEQIGRVDNNGCTYGKGNPQAGAGTHLHYEWRDNLGRSIRTTQPILDIKQCGYSGSC